MLSIALVGNKLKSILLSQGIFKGTPSKNRVNCRVEDPLKYIWLSPRELF